MHCVECGVEITDPDQKFCEGCGNEILSNEVVSKTIPVIKEAPQEEHVKKRKRRRCC